MGSGTCRCRMRSPSTTARQPESLACCDSVLVRSQPSGRSLGRHRPRSSPRPLRDRPRRRHPRRHRSTGRRFRAGRSLGPHVSPAPGSVGVAPAHRQLALRSLTRATRPAAGPDRSHLRQTNNTVRRNRRDFAPRMAPRAAERFDHLFRGLGVRRTRRHDPHDPAFLIRAIPDPPARGHLVLPLRQRSAADLALGELTT